MSLVVAQLSSLKANDIVAEGKRKKKKNKKNPHTKKLLIMNTHNKKSYSGGTY